MATYLNNFTRSQVNYSNIDGLINYYIEVNTNYSSNQEVYDVGTKWYRTLNCNYNITCSDGNAVSGSLQQTFNGSYNIDFQINYNPVDFLNENDSLKQYKVNLEMTWTYQTGQWKWGNKSITYWKDVNNIDSITADNTQKKRAVINNQEAIDWEEKPVYDWVYYDDDGDGINDRREWEIVDYENDYDKPIKWRVWYYYEYSIAGSAISNEGKTATANFDFYPSSISFSFNNCAKDNKWNVAEGLQTLIDNIYLFTPYATQLKNWKFGNPENSNNLNNQGSCPSWQRGKLSANNLNAIHSYIGTGNSYVAGYGKESRISANMFNSLTSKMNEWIQ